MEQQISDDGDVTAARTEAAQAAMGPAAETEAAAEAAGEEAAGEAPGADDGRRRVVLDLPMAEPVGYENRSPTMRLTAQQARTVAAIHAGLVAQGVRLRGQAEVYGWLLDQIRGQL